MALADELDDMVEMLDKQNPKLYKDRTDEALKELQMLKGIFSNFEVNYIDG